jgi:hypothetical protein
LSRAHFLRRLGGMVERANWEPLLELAPEEIDDFMWMFEIELEDGAMTQAYKHWWTRRYLYLDFAGRAFVEVGPRSFEQVDPERSLEEVLAGRERGAKIVRQNVWIAAEDIEFARSATRHRVGRRHTFNVIRHAGICFEEKREAGPKPRLYYFGDGENGRELEVIAVKLEADRLLVIHSMAMRARFRIDYLEAARWRT